VASWPVIQEMMYTVQAGMSFQVVMEMRPAFRMIVETLLVK
jgi:hypothetical protein